MIVILVILFAACCIVNWSYLAGTPARSHLERGIALSNARDARGAEAEWRQALRMDPARAEPYQLLARLYLDTGSPGQAVPLLEHLRQISPRSEHTLCSLAEAYTRLDQTTKGLETARQAALLEPDCARAHALLGIHLGNQQDTRGALVELTRAVALAPRDNKIAMSLAQAELDASDLPGAERLARAVIARDPRYSTAWYTLGRSYSRRDPTPENLKISIDSYTKAVALNPALGDAYSELGRLRVLAGDYKGAIRDLEYLWKHGVHNKEGAFNLATAYRKVGDAAHADKLSREFKRMSDFATRYDALSKHLSVEPSNLDVALELAELETQSGNLADAIPLVQGVLQKRPRDPRALRAAVALYDRLGQQQMAESLRIRLHAAQNPSAERNQ